MTVAVSNANSFTLFARLQDLRTQLSTYVAKRRVYVQACQELQALSNRDLDDIGISRADIRDVAYAHAFGS